MTQLTHHPLGVRIRMHNPNHHLWNNHGIWFLHYTIYPTPFTKQRVRRSLRTREMIEARHLRDRIFEQLMDSGTKQVAA